MNTGETRQIIGNKLGIAAVFADVDQHMLTFTIGSEAKIFHHHEIFWVSFQHTTTGGLTVQPT
ncbi:hypothetical protein D1872_345700 [compost metagenome]